MALSFADVMVTARMTRVATVDIAAYTPVRLGTDPETVLPISPTAEWPVGVTEFAVQAGQPAVLLVEGLLPVRVLLAVDGGELVWAQSGGVRPYIAAGGFSAYRHIVGRALTAGAANELVMVNWHPHSIWQDNGS